MPSTHRFRPYEPRPGTTDLSGVVLPEELAVQARFLVHDMPDAAKKMKQAGELVLAGESIGLELGAQYDIQPHPSNPDSIILLKQTGAES